MAPGGCGHPDADRSSDTRACGWRVADPPESLDFGGPEPLTRHEVVDAVERAVGERFRRVVVPRSVLAAGAWALRRHQLEFGTGLGIAVSMDVSAHPGLESMETVGVQPRSASAYIAAHADRSTAG